MIRRKVRLKITTTSREALTFGKVLNRHCPSCQHEVEMLTSAEAAGVLEVDSQTFDHLVAEGLVHTIQTVTGTLRICKDSLFTK